MNTSKKPTPAQKAAATKAANKAIKKQNAIHAARVAEVLPAPAPVTSATALGAHDNVVAYAASFHDKDGQFQLFLKVVAASDNVVGNAKNDCLNRLKIEGLYDGTTKGKRKGPAKTTINYSLIIGKAIAAMPEIDLLDNWDRTKLEALYTPKLVPVDNKTGLAIDNPLPTGKETTKPVNHTIEPTNDGSTRTPPASTGNIKLVDDIDNNSNDDAPIVDDVQELFELVIESLDFDKIQALTAKLDDFVKTAKTKAA